MKAWISVTEVDLRRFRSLGLVTFHYVTFFSASQFVSRVIKSSISDVKNRLKAPFHSQPVLIFQKDCK